jgi:hypothetical protein
MHPFDITQWIDFRLNLTTIIAIVAMIVGALKAYYELNANHKALDRAFTSHVAEAVLKFSSLATKETSSLQNTSVENKLDDIIDRLVRLEELHMNNKPR